MDIRMSDKSNVYKTLGQYTYNPNDYLGTGAYGKVYRAFFDGDPKRVVAIKEIHYKMAQKEKEDIFIKTCQQEIQELWQLKSNKHIVQLHDVINTTDTFYLIMEYCNQGNLKKFRQDKKLSEEEVLFLFQQIIEGFKYIRKLNKIHRDIKPENILVHNNVLKIADFQFARTLLDEEYAFTYAGTDAYMAPEVIEGAAQISNVDIWSLGVTLYYLFFELNPWLVNLKARATPVSVLREIKSQLLENNKLYFPSDKIISEESKKLIVQMLVFDKSQRISWEELFNHPLLTKEYKKIGFNLTHDNENEPTFLPPKTNLGSYIRLEEFGGDGKVMKDAEETHIASERKRENIQKVKRRIEYERDISLFIYNILLRIKETKVQIPEDLYYRMMFLLCKRMFAHFHFLKASIEKKENKYKIEKQMWLDFFNADLNKEPSCTKVEKIISNEYDEYQKLFQSFLASSKEIFNNPESFKKWGIEPKFLERFMRVLNEDLDLKSDYFKVCEETTIEFIKSVYHEFMMIKPDSITPHEIIFLNLLDDLFIFLTLKKSFPWNSQNPHNLQKFYDDRKFANPAIIIDRILQSYHHFDLLN